MLVWKMSKNKQYPMQYRKCIWRIKSFFDSYWILLHIFFSITLGVLHLFYNMLGVLLKLVGLIKCILTLKTLLQLANNTTYVTQLLQVMLVVHIITSNKMFNQHDMHLRHYTYYQKLRYRFNRTMTPSPSNEYIMNRLSLVLMIELSLFVFSCLGLYLIVLFNKVLYANIAG